MLAGVAIASFIVALTAVRVLLSSFRALALDEPNARSLHELPVPRTGGIAILAGTSVSVFFSDSHYWLPLALALGLAVISFMDDLRGMPTLARLLAHAAAAAVLAWYALAPLNLLQLVLLVIALTWITDLYNFMDGSDGLAGGMAVIGFGAYALAAQVAGEAPLAALCTAIAAASAGFLVHNFHPAKIFLGDVGSIPLGFLAGALGMYGWRHDVWPFWFPVLVFGPFIGDATITLFKRLFRREKVWQAHRDHYYQRLVRMGFGHRATALVGYAIMAACAAGALIGRTQPPIIQALVFLAAVAALAAMATWIDLRWSRFNRTT
jgi:UDP-N-acetylmuramyl pentapeptide phosphotransferase/UDP-N-acetylglucosamine-1-phosphate transferase